MIARVSASLVSVVSLVALASCSRGGANADAGADAAPSASVVSSAAPASSGPPPLTIITPTGKARTSDVPEPLSRLRGGARAGESIAIPAGTFKASSEPGEEGRDPTTEPRAFDATVSAFSIDALPYPNDPAEPPKTNISRGDAERLCRERGARLCTEVEWERACRGPQNGAYATGETWDPACVKDAKICPSGYGARAMGALREWTASPFGESVAVRGGGLKAPYSARCAHRERGLEAQSIDIGFRCCKGAPSVQAYASIESKPTFRPARIGVEEFAKIVAGIPELSRIAADVHFFDPSDETYLSRSDKPHDGYTFTTKPILWSPEAGTELLVATGHTKALSFVVALHVLAEGKYKAAAYFYMQGDVAPVALAYMPPNGKLYWTTCWQCTAETGSLKVRSDHAIVIVQH